MKTLSRLCCCALAGMVLIVSAQSYPTKPLRLIVTYPAGVSTNDILGRAMAQKLADALGQNVVVDNRPGASGAMGTEMVARAPADGYTLLLAANGPIAISPHVSKNLPYDPLRDLAPVTMFAVIPYVLVVHPSVKATTVHELIALAKTQPGKLNHASAGSGSTPHLCVEMLKSMAGINMVHVPYKGGAPAATDLLAGHVQLYCAGVFSMSPQIKAGKLRALAVTTLKRSAAMPELPTVAETGLPGFDAASWNGIMVPARTPRPIINRLHDAIVNVVTQAEMKSFLATQGAEPATLGPDEFREFIRVELAKWGKVVKSAGVTD